MPSSAPRLRFDKVATRVLERLQAALEDDVPKGVCVTLTITAPIRLASKTTVGIEGKVRALIGRRSRRDAATVIQGNGIRIRIVRGVSRRAPALVGFVHHVDSDRVLLLDTAEDVLAAGTAGTSDAIVRAVLRVIRSS